MYSLSYSIKELWNTKISVFYLLLIRSKIKFSMIIKFFFNLSISNSAFSYMFDVNSKYLYKSLYEAKEVKALLFF